MEIDQCHSNKRDKNLLLLTQGLKIGGLELIVLELGISLKSVHDWNVSVFSHDSDGQSVERNCKESLFNQFIDAGIKTEARKKKRGFSFDALLNLIIFSIRNKISIMHAHDLGTLIYAVFANILSFNRSKIIYTQHSLVHLERSNRYRRYERFFTLFVSQIIVVSESLLKPYSKLGIALDQMAVVPNGVRFLKKPLRDREMKLLYRGNLIQNLDELSRKKLEVFTTSFWILYLARFHSSKGQRELASIWNSLDSNVRSNSTLILIGPEAEAGEKQIVEKLFEGAPNRERVLFFGGTQYPQEWIRSSDLFVSCSRFEGMPLGPIEAIGSGLPAVLSAIDGHSFLSKNSLTYPLDNSREGAAQIEQIFHDPLFGSTAYYQNLWETAKDIRIRHSLEAMTKEYAAIYSRYI